MEVVCFAVIPVLGLVAAALWWLVGWTRRDEERLSSRAQAEARALVVRLRLAGSDPWPKDPESCRSRLLPHMSVHLLDRVDFEALLQELGDSTSPPWTPDA